MFPWLLLVAVWGEWGLVVMFAIAFAWRSVVSWHTVAM